MGSFVKREFEIVHVATFTDLWHVTWMYILLTCPSGVRYSEYISNMYLLRSSATSGASREGGREGGREGEKEGGREGGREGEKEGEKEGGREGGREGRRERGREGRRGRER